MSVLSLSDTALKRFKATSHLRPSPARIALRRMRPGTLPPLEAVALVVALGGNVDGPTERVQKAFDALQLCALLADQDVPNAYLGEALEAAGVSELRLERLLRARPEQVADQLRAVARHLRAQNTPVRVRDLIRLLVSDDQALRMTIAQSYYRAANAKGGSHA